MKNRLFIALSTIVAGSVVIPFNFYDYIFFNSSFELHDIAIIMVQLIIFMWALFSGLLKEQERKFLNNAVMIQSRYYQIYFEPAIAIFNNKVEDSKIKELLVSADLRERERVKVIFENIINISIDSLKARLEARR